MMHTIFKKLTSLVLVAFMVLSMVPIVAVTANAATGDTYQLVTDASTLAVGDTIIIVATDYGYALSTTQNSNNRGQVGITKSEDKTTISNIGTDVQTITLEEGTTTGTFAFKVDGVYLYAASSSKNYLRTQTTLDANGSWTITITDGVATVTAQGNYTHNLLQYNKSSSIFSSYISAQQNISIYKLAKSETVCDHINTEPIGEAKDATCTVDGITAGEKCSDCGTILEEQAIIPATGHTYENGECTVCHEKEPTKYVLVTDIATLAEDSQIVIVYKAGNMAMGAQNNGNYREKVGITISENTFEYVDGVCVLTLGGNSTVGWTLKASDGYLYYSGSSNSLNTGDEANKWNISISDSGIATIQYKTNESRYLQYNTSSPRFACYLGTQQDVSIFMPYCSHANTEEKAEVPATCTEDGREAGKFCNDCKTYIEGGAVIPALGHDWGEWVQTTAPGCETAGEETRSCARCDETETQPVEKLGHNWIGWTETIAATCTATGVQTGTCSRCGETKTVEIPTTGHTYVDGTCSECGAEEPSASETSTATLSFASTDNRSSWTSEQQVWEQNNVKLINNKTSESSAIIDASNPARFYKSSTITIEYAGMTKIEFACYSEDYATALKTSIGDSATVSGTIVTVTFDAAQDTFEISKLSAQVRLDSLTVTSGSSTGSSTESSNPIVKWNITLQDNLKVNFHLDLNEGEQVYLKVGSAEVIYNLSDLTKTAEGYYVATVSMAAAQMMDEINVQVIDLANEKLLANKTYTIRQYADVILGDNDQSKYHALVKEMLNYGGMAQVFFGYNTGNLANAGITDVGKTVVPNDDNNTMTHTDPDDGCITFYGASLVYRDKIAVRYYFDAIEGQDLTFQAGGNVCEPVMISGHYVIEVPDICPQDYDTQIHVTVTNAEGHTAEVDYGPMNYIVRMYHKEGATQEMQDLLQALYNYHLAAVAYIAAQTA